MHGVCHVLKKNIIDLTPTKCKKCNPMHPMLEGDPMRSDVSFQLELTMNVCPVKLFDLWPQFDYQYTEPVNNVNKLSAINVWCITCARIIAPTSSLRSTPTMIFTMTPVWYVNPIYSEYHTTCRDCPQLDLHCILLHFCLNITYFEQCKPIAWDPCMVYAKCSRRISLTSLRPSVKSVTLCTQCLKATQCAVMYPSKWILQWMCAL